MEATRGDGVSALAHPENRARSSARALSADRAIREGFDAQEGSSTQQRQHRSRLRRAATANASIAPIQRPPSSQAANPQPTYHSGYG